jgi:hypothetical protein
MAASDVIFGREVAKYASQRLYGIIKRKTGVDDLMYILNKQMILQVLGDSSCLEELSTDEQTALQGQIILKS